MPKAKVFRLNGRKTHESAQELSRRGGGGIKIHRSIVTKLPIILGKIWNCMRPARNKMFSDVKTSNLITNKKCKAVRRLSRHRCVPAHAQLNLIDLSYSVTQTRRLLFYLLQRGKIWFYVMRAV